jgi:hypothetical protein
MWGALSNERSGLYFSVAAFSGLGLAGLMSIIFLSFSETERERKKVQWVTLH